VKARRSSSTASSRVAVPVPGEDGEIVGVLGASVYLDVLSARIDEALRLGPQQIFYAVDAEPRTALNKETDLIFASPLEEEDPEIERAFTEILANEEGVIEYEFRERRRTVRYRRSEVTGWWYAFGIVQV
jgi:hypothetical protein